MPALLNLIGLLALLLALFIRDSSPAWVPFLAIGIGLQLTGTYLDYRTGVLTFRGMRAEKSTKPFDFYLLLTLRLAIPVVVIAIIISL